MRNAIERAVLLNDGPLISADQLSFLDSKGMIPAGSERAPEIHVPQAGMSLDELNKNLIIQALEMSNGNKAKAAKLLGMSRPTMIYRIEKYGIQVPEKD